MNNEAARTAVDPSPITRQSPPSSGETNANGPGGPAFEIDPGKLADEARYDGIFVLRTNARIWPLQGGAGRGPVPPRQGSAAHPAG